jgi:hypothetical protein
MFCERKKGGAKVTKVRVLSMGCNLHVAFICGLLYIFHIYIYIYIYINEYQF